jgi:acyl-CoA thioester hydrolase
MRSMQEPDGYFPYRHTVCPEEIDSNGHANNVAYVEWMQRAAVAHSAALGWPGERYRRLGSGWVARSHTITYFRPAFAGEQIVVRTWVADMKKATSTRRYRIVREADGQLLAEAETHWAYIDYATGRPTRIAREVMDSFPTGAAP